MMGLRVSSTNGNWRQRDVVRVYLDDEKIAEVFIPSRNPLGYLWRHPGSKYCANLSEQLAPHGLTLLDVFAAS